ncbi:MAG: TetR/AcrR family transcriptional regulator [Sandaracinaceae bacterium]
MSTAEITEKSETDGRIARAAKLRAQRRQTVLDAALRVFSAKGYHQTRIADIIEEASIARGTFYLYFDSKHAIFDELLDDLLRRVDRSVEGVDMAPEAAPVRDQLLKVVKRVLIAFREDRMLAKLILREAVGLDAEIDEKLSAFHHQLHAWLTQSLSRGQHIGLIRAIDPVLTAWCILGSVKQFLQLVLEAPDDQLDLDHLSEVILDYNLQGIRA